MFEDETKCLFKVVHTWTVASVLGLIFSWADKENVWSFKEEVPKIPTLANIHKRRKS
jgi:hypothetical protein